MNSMIVLLVGVSFCLVLLVAAYSCSFPKRGVALNVPLVRGLIVAQTVTFAAFSTSILPWIAEEMVCSVVSPSNLNGQCVELGFHNATTALRISSALALGIVVIGCFLSTGLLAYPAISDHFKGKNACRAWRGVGSAALLCAICSGVLLTVLAQETSTPSGGRSFHTGAYCVMLSLGCYVLSCLIICMMAPKMQRMAEVTASAVVDDVTVATHVGPQYDDVDRHSMEDDVDSVVLAQAAAFAFFHAEQPQAQQTTRPDEDRTTLGNNNAEAPHSTPLPLHVWTIGFYLWHVAGSTTLLVLYKVDRWVNLIGGVWMFLLVPYHSFGARYVYQCARGTQQPTKLFRRIPIPTDAERLLRLNLVFQMGLFVSTGVAVSIYYLYGLAG